MHVRPETPIIDTPYLQYRTLKNLHELHHNLQPIVQGNTHDPPLLLASTFSEVSFFPKGYSPLPIVIKPGKIMDNGKEIEAVMVDYWVDGDPESASGIVHRESIALVRNENGIQAYTYSQPLDSRGESRMMTSSDKKFRQQAEKLWNAIGKAASLATEQLPNIYADYRYDFNQILASHEILRNITTIMHGEQLPSQTSPTPLRRRWPFAARTPQSVPLQTRTRAA